MVTLAHAVGYLVTFSLPMFTRTLDYSNYVSLSSNRLNTPSLTMSVEEDTELDIPCRLSR